MKLYFRRHATLAELGNFVSNIDTERVLVEKVSEVVTNESASRWWGFFTEEDHSHSSDFVEKTRLWLSMYVVSAFRHSEQS